MLLDLWAWRKIQVINGGLPQPRFRTEEEIKAERIALGIIPADVAKVVNKVAKKAIKSATVKRIPDVVKWVAQDSQMALYERQMRLEMARHDQIWSAAYARLLVIAVEEMILAEEEAIVLLMFEL